MVTKLRTLAMYGPDAVKETRGGKRMFDLGSYTNASFASSAHKPQGFADVWRKLAKETDD